MLKKPYTIPQSLGSQLLHLAALCLLVVSTSNTQAETHINLKDAVVQALSQSLAAKRSALSLEQARISSEIVETSDDPTLSLNGAWGSRWQKRTSSSSPSFNEHSKIHSYSAQLRYTLLDFGRQTAKELSALNNVKLQQLAKEDADEKIFWSVVRAYQDVAAAERIVAISKEQELISQNRLAEQVRNYKQGLRPESDVVTAEVDVGKAKLNLQTNLNQAVLAKQTLALLLSPDNVPDTNFSVRQGSVLSSGPRTWDMLIADVEKQTVTSTTAIKLLEASKEALTADKKALDASNNPVLGTVVSGEYAGDAGNWSPLRPAASGQLQLSWDVPWNGMNRLAKTNLALKKQDLELQEKNVLNNISQNERYARTLINQTKNLHESMRAQVKLVEKQLKLVQDRYKVGQASALDLSTAESVLVNMRLDQIKLSNNVADAIITFAEARGVRSIELLSKL